MAVEGWFGRRPLRVPAVTIKSGQKMYRLRGPDGKWAKKGNYLHPLEWVEKEERATFWKKIAHLKTAKKDGTLQRKICGLPEAAVTVVEYEVTLVRTGRKHRLSELDEFYRKDDDDGTKEL